jgi:hypothetical protein
VEYSVTGGTATGDGVDYTLAPGSLTFAPGDTVQTIAVTVIDDPISETDETVILALSNASGATLNEHSSHVLAITNQSGTLAVTPGSEFSSAGPGGGPFDPQSAAWTLRNTGDSPLTWAALADADWIDLSPADGTLDPGEAIDVTLTFDGDAGTLLPGRYRGIVTFSNLTNGQGSGTRAANLDVRLGVPEIAGEPPFTGGSTNAITWGPLSGAERYEVERSEFPDFSAAVSSGWIGGTEHVFAGLHDASSHFYRVRAWRTAAMPPAGSWSAAVTSTQDAGPPLLAITGPDAPIITPDADFLISGTVSDAVSGVAAVLVNGIPAAVDEATGAWSLTVEPLTPGPNQISLTASDNAVPANLTTGSHSVYFATDDLDVDRDGLPDGWEYSHRFDLFDDGNGAVANGALGDSDFDGLPNLLEFAFNRNPTLPDASDLISLTTSAQPPGDPQLLLTYIRRAHAPGIKAEIQFSPDSSVWSPEPGCLDPVSVLPNPDGITETVTLRILPCPADAESRRRFFRLTVSPVLTP